MAYIYSNNGLTWHWRDPADTSPLVVGEFASDHLLSDIEIAAQFPGNAAAENKITVLQQIAVLEDSITPRRMRDLALGRDTTGWIANVETQIAALRAKI